MNVLLADPDRNFTRDVLEHWSLQEAPLTVVSTHTDLLQICKDETFGLVLLSTDLLVLKDLDGISFLKEHQPGCEVIVLCDGKSVQVAENALSRGASSYLLKPVLPRVLESTARKSLQRIRSRRSYRLMEDHVLEDLLGNTPEMRKILRLLYKVAPTTSTILITGESGTGKEFVSNIIHRLSKRAEEPFVTVNCGAIPDNIVESELFGSRKGAFTGAVANKKGLFEEADNGTLFLDEVAELTPAAQVKLLRFLQSKEIRPVGGTEIRYVDVRIIAATNKNVPLAIRDGEFREDLFYRLNTFHIHLPPLRERKSTIPNLVKFFVLKYGQENSKQINRIHPAAQLALTSYDYPGNIRELENIIEHAVVMAEGEELRLEDLPEHLRGGSNVLGLLPERTLAANQEIHLDGRSENRVEHKAEVHQTDEHGSNNSRDIATLEEIERQHIMRALAALGNNQTEVSRKLGISRSTLWRKLQEHRIELK